LSSHDFHTIFFFSSSPHYKKDNTYPVNPSFSVCLCNVKKKEAETEKNALMQGCGSDVPGHWYSLSRALNPHWKTYYPSQDEMRAYCNDVWTKHGLETHTRFGTEVVRATWDARTHTYGVILEDVVSHTRRTVTARVVISAAGGFMGPRVPEDLVRGRERFRGVAWHSAEWRHDVALEGKRVGVIGNGCSAYVHSFRL
jgi:cation diffusion facilitator CzcD-associated flavoprotein CzcO